MGSTHSWMVPPQSLLPDGQCIVQQVGCLLVFVLIPARTHKATHSVRMAERKTLGRDPLSRVTRSNVDFSPWTVPTVNATSADKCLKLDCKYGPPLCSPHTREQMRFVEVACERRQKKEKRNLLRLRLQFFCLFLFLLRGDKSFPTAISVP